MSEVSSRLRRRVRSGLRNAPRPSIEGAEHEAARMQWVRDNAPGRSFLDIGGLFKYMGDVSFLAEDSGATKVTLFDVGDPDLPAIGHEDWGSFAQKREARQSKVRHVQGNLDDHISMPDVGPHDVAFYSGVLYHTPHPVLQLMNLRELVSGVAYLSTLTIPEVRGREQACIFYPHLSDLARARYAAGYHWSHDLLAIGPPFDASPMLGYANCWWGITRSALRSMLRTARFEVLEERPTPTGEFMTDFIIRAVPADSSMPPMSYFRDRAAARERGEPRWSYDTWYEDQRAGRTTHEPNH